MSAVPVEATPLAWALRHAARGWPVLLLNENSKLPLGSDWQRRATADTSAVDALWTNHPRAGVGILCTGRLLVLDVDCKSNKEGVPARGFESLAELEERHGSLPRTYTVRTPSGGTHFYFNVESPPSWLTNSASKLGPGLDVRAGGKGYVAAPGTTLAEGAYELMDDVDPAPCPQWILEALEPKKSAATPVVRPALSAPSSPAPDRYAPRAFESALAAVTVAPEGARNDTLSREAFGLFRLVGAGRLRDADVEAALRRAAQGAGLESAEIEATIQSARKGLESPNREGLPRQTAVNASALPKAGRAANDDGPPLPLPPALLPVQAFPIDAVPGALGDWIGDVAERMQCPPDFIALPLLVAAGSLVARHGGVRPKQHDAWTEVPNLWGCIVGRPGAMKSPALSEALFALRRMEAQARESHGQLLSAHSAEVAAAKLRADARKDKARAELKKNASADVATLLVDDSPVAPPEPRLLVNDATVEALGEILAKNPGGVLAERDELASLLRNLAREEQATARGFMLTAWSGKEAYRWDRITRGSVVVPCARVAVIGGTQPGPLGTLVGEAVGGGDDGLLQRFLFAWPDARSEWTNCDREPNRRAKDAVFAMFARLRDVPPDGMQADTFPDGSMDGFPFLRFATDAADVFHEWLADLEPRLRAESLPPILEAAMSKYRKHVPALAVTLHAAEGGIGPIGRKATLCALALAEYFESHTRRVFDSGQRPVVEAAHALLRKLASGDLPAEGFTVRDAYRPQWAGLREPAVVGEALTLLCERRHLNAEVLETGGRDAIVFRWRRAA